MIIKYVSTSGDPDPSGCSDRNRIFPLPGEMIAATPGEDGGKKIRNENREGVRERRGKITFVRISFHSPNYIFLFTMKTNC